MNEPINPYAPPQVVEATVLPDETRDYWVWREGNTLVMAKESQLPPVCVKCSLPAQSWLKRALQWHPPAVFFVLVLGLIPYVIVALLMMKRATIHVGLCDTCRTRRRNAILITWLLVLASMGMFIGGIAIAGNQQWEAVGGFTILGSIVLFVGALVFAIVRVSTVRPKRISDRTVWLKGVHRDVLNQLPEWPRYE